MKTKPLSNNKLPNEVNPYDLSSALKERQWFKSDKNKKDIPVSLWDALGDIFNHKDYK